MNKITEFPIVNEFGFCGFWLVEELYSLKSAGWTALDEVSIRFCIFTNSEK
jgi:hypothetical protein